jgi:hypothetical protein
MAGPDVRSPSLVGQCEPDWQSNELAWLKTQGVVLPDQEELRDDDRRFAKSIAWNLLPVRLTTKCPVLKDGAFKSNKGSHLRAQSPLRIDAQDICRRWRTLRPGRRQDNIGLRRRYDRWRRKRRGCFTTGENNSRQQKR